MGLDSYLYTSSKELANAVAEWMDKSGRSDSCESKWCREEGMIGYWRKYSALHNWMVENVQYHKDDCGIYELSYNDLQNLWLIVCKEYENPGSTDFQPTNGFFFNPTDAEEWNRFQLEDLYKFLDFLMSKIERYKDSSGTCMKGEDWNAHICYVSSW